MFADYAAGVAAALGALAVFLTMYAILAPFREIKKDTIRSEFFGETIDSHTVQSGIGKYAKPLLDNFTPQLPAIAVSDKNRKKTEEFLRQAGNPWKLTPEEYSSMKYIFGGFGFLAGLVLGVLNVIPQVPPYALILLFTGIGFAIPFSTYNSAKQSRAKEAQKELPEALDLLVVTLSSSKTFEASLNDVVEQLPDGLVRTEFDKMNLKIKAGTTLERALRDFMNEIASEEVESFCKAIIQSQKLGADITETLSQQATFARDNHEARVEKMIARLSTTMFIYLAPTMLPAFLIIFIAPAIEQLTSML